MKAIQRIKRLVKRITSMTLRGRCGGYDRASEGRDPRDGGRARPRPEERYASDSSAFVLRHGILSLYSYIRKFVPWRSRTYIQNLRHVRIAGVTSSFLFGLLALAIIIPLYNVTGTEDTEAATGTAIDSSITFTSTRNTATVDLTPTSASGTFASSTSGTTDAAFSITTTNSQGYELKIKSTSSTVLKPTTTTSDSDGLSTISTSGITSSSFTNNTWGYLPNYYNCDEASGTCSTNTTNYYPATTSDVTLRKTTSANNTAHNYTIGLGAKADLTKTSGTYTLGGNKGSLVLTYVANPTAYSITFNKGNTTDTVNNMPYSSTNNNVSGSVSATSITITDGIPTRTGYDFKGWCTVLPTTTNGVDSCKNSAGTTGTIYNAAGATSWSYGIDRTSSNTVTLYALWTKASVNVTINFAGSGVTGVTFANDTYGNVTVSTSGNTAALKYGVQYDITGTYSSGYEFSSWAATAGSLGSTTTASTTYSTTIEATLTLTGKASAVYTDFCTKNGIPDSQCLQKMSFSNCPTTATSFTDMRDGNTYKIQKLADGSCWLLDNLAIDLASAQTMVNLTADTTNATNAELGYLKNGGGTTSDQYATSGVISWPSSSSSFSVPWVAVSGNIYGGGTWDVNTTVTSYGSGSGKVGAYYNYCAASAGTYCYGNGTSYGTPSGNATADICPAGWQMPSTTDSNNVVGSYYYLYNTAYSANATNFRNALSTPLSGMFDNGSAYAQGVYGYFWSSTRGGSNASMSSLLAYSTYVSPASDYTRNNGYSVRCVMTPPPTMQSIAVSDVAEGEEVSLADERDDQIYTVKKINGRLWMTRNLAIGCNGSGSTYGSSVSSKSLTSGNSNVSNTWSTPTALLSTSANSSSTSGYTTAAMQCSSTYGAWYNYAAATAGTITGPSNYAAATKDICPAGWHLPTGSNTTSGTDFNILVGNTTSSWQDPTTGLTAFSAVAGGSYGSGSLYNTGRGYWWSATAGTTTARFSLIYDSSNGQFRGNSDYGARYYGFYVRCVMAPPTMQSIAVSDVAEGKEITAIDARDGKDYTIKKINGYLWMTQNLRFTGTSLDTTNSNVTSNKTLTWYSLKDNGASGGKCHGTYAPSGDGYSNACLQDSGSTETGVWYNYFGATAGTVSGTSNSTAASQDICPKNWHLPSGPSTESGTDFNILVGNTTSGWQKPTTGLTAFSAVAGGYYYNASFISTGYGYWWSATADNATRRYSLNYSSSDGQFKGNDYYYRYCGYYVRCVRTS